MQAADESQTRVFFWWNLEVILETNKAVRETRTRNCDQFPIHYLPPLLLVPSPQCPHTCGMVRCVFIAGANRVCLGDLAAFWKAFVQEVRFVWEEGSSIPRMVRASSTQADHFLPLHRRPISSSVAAIGACTCTWWRTACSTKCIRPTGCIGYPSPA